MDIHEEFLRVMATQTTMTLATSVDDQPDVRVVNFCFDPETMKLYFSSFPEGMKVEQIARNPRVAFMTLPTDRHECVRAQGEACLSAKTIDDVSELFESKTPGFKEHIQGGKDRLILFEVGFSRARVILPGHISQVIDI